MAKAVELAMPLPPDTNLRVLLDEIDKATVTAPKTASAAKEDDMQEDNAKKGKEGLSNRALKRVSS